jgi:hypothetical protein
VLMLSSCTPYLCCFFTRDSVMNTKNFQRVLNSSFVAINRISTRKVDNSTILFFILLHGVRECVGPFFPYVAHLLFLKGVHMVVVR